jgi:hypothetical protein
VCVVFGQGKLAGNLRVVSQVSFQQVVSEPVYEPGCDG